MFKLLNAKTVKPYKSFCSNKLNQLKNVMYNDYGFECDFSLIGSGARNLVTQNENEPFDLEYNFYLYSFPEDFDINSTQDLKWLKDTMRTELNNILKNTARPWGETWSARSTATQAARCSSSPARTAASSTLKTTT